MDTPKLRLNRLPSSAKILITACVLSLAVGYGVALLQVQVRTHFHPNQTVSHFRGTPENTDDSVDGAEPIAVPQSDMTLISVAHVHAFSQPVVLALMGFLFLWTGFSERWKIFWILLSFGGSLASNACPWLIRDVSPRFVGGLYAGGGAMFLSFVVMAISVLWTTWCDQENGHVSG